MYSAINIAKFIVSYCYLKGNPISNLKLQKLLYYVWIEYYKQTNRWLFNNAICAWQLGPVVPEVYNEFSSFAGIPIRRQYMSTEEIPEEDMVLIAHAIDLYLPMTAGGLVEKTHEPGKPWDRVYQNGLGRHNVIPFSTIVALECN